MTVMMENIKRKSGRPRKFGQGRVNATVRFAPERYAELRAEAVANGRSVSEQVEYMVERCSAYDRMIEALKHR